MSRREIEQVSIFEQLKNKDIKQKEAVKMLNLGIRQVKRKLKDYRKYGAIALVNKNRGRPSHNHLDESLVKQALLLLETKYPDFKPTFACEKLKDNHSIVINKESLRKRMIAEGLWKPKQRKVNLHLMRERKDCFGELVQLDGSDHAWFEDRAPKCTLIAFIDDATSRIAYLEFTSGETTENLMKTTWEYLKIHGKPAAFYTDRGGVYKVNLNNPNDDKLTQYGRALEELGINHIHARSPQAKGRVERLFGTLQDRLVKELRLKGISSIEEANKYLKEEYIAKHNSMFAVMPKSETNLHQSINGDDLNNIFCIKEDRKINNDFTVAYKTKWLQLSLKQPTIIYPKETVEIWQHLDSTITIHQNKSVLNYKEVNQRPKQPITKTRKESVKSINSWIPEPNHPWKKFVIVRQKRGISKLHKSDICTLEKRDILTLV